MGNRPSSVQPAHWDIFEKTKRIKDPVALAKVTQSILAKPELVAVARRHGVLEWLQANASYQHPTAKQTTIATLTALVIHPTATATPAYTSGGVSTSDPRLAAFEREEERKQREFQEAAKKRRDDFLRQIAGMSDGNAYAVLGIGPEATFDEVKKAYRRRAIETHPDKGGSEAAFDQVTKAFAFITEELKKTARAQSATFEQVAAERENTVPQQTRDPATGEIHTAFGLINPKKFDVKMFNKIFEATKIADPDEEGYEDWFRGGEDTQASSAPVFSGAFNRDVFNRMFEEHATSASSRPSEALMAPDEIMTTDRIGHSELGGGRPREFTAATGSGMQYTDLRAAFTEHNIITTNDPRATARQGRTTLRDYEAERSAVMAKPMTTEEREFETRRETEANQREAERQARLRQRDEQHAMLYDRMTNTRMLPDEIQSMQRGSGLSIPMRPQLMAPGPAGGALPALPAPVNPRTGQPVLALTNA